MQNTIPQLICQSSNKRYYQMEELNAANLKTAIGVGNERN